MEVQGKRPLVKQVGRDRDSGPSPSYRAAPRKRKRETVGPETRERIVSWTWKKRGITKLSRINAESHIA